MAWMASWHERRGAKAIAVSFKTGFPFRFKCAFSESLMRSRFHGGNPKGTLLRLSGLRNINSSDRQWLSVFPALGMNTLNHVESKLRRDGFDSIYSCAALDFVNSFWSFWTVRSLPHCSARKILFCMRYTCCSNLRQGSLRQLSLSGSSRSFPLGAFVFAIRLVALSSLSPCPRLHILDITPGFGFLGNPSLKCLRVVPCSPYRPPTRASLRVLPFR